MASTTVPRERRNAERCLEAHRLRWQIELQFKRWKSLCGFQRLPSYRDDTIVAGCMQGFFSASCSIGCAPSEASIFAPRCTSPCTRRRSVNGGEGQRSMARQPWKLTSILYSTAVAAFLPLTLREVSRHFPRS